jgi:hypothetical protein
MCIQGVAQPVIPATQEAEIRRIAVRGQPGKIAVETLSRKTHHKKGLVEWFKVKALSSNPSTQKKKCNLVSFYIFYHVPDSRFFSFFETGFPHVTCFGPPASAFWAAGTIGVSNHIQQIPEDLNHPLSHPISPVPTGITPHPILSPACGSL